jgi:transcriptional regulator with XRE-family HTH domain
MSDVAQLLLTLKRQLKARGLTYRELARALELSEASVKRLFSQQRLTVERLAQIAAVLGLNLAELTALAAADTPKLHSLTREQEARLVGDGKLLVIAVCALNHWTLEEMLAEFRLTRAECLKRLLQLDRMGLIELLPGDRIRARIARDFDWLPSGPIRSYFRAEGQGDFLEAPFAGLSESAEFVHAMLTTPAQAQLLQELRRLRQRFALLHDESLAAPLSERYAVGLLLAARRWEPRVFKALRRGDPGRLPESQAE